ncbi:hypothetical protein RHSIM_Rhsim07G0043800 [Rhododendron simsii]|uniref:R13L1/DRL21-like LRR repeat region domain-containing protein n=1 Tax=Rhododendron simsii TaxID=118357 RepID=A0A834GRX6_RHOSS|nr:hypothetical protein RHSIM_Rhsim07G0043800 [Rhododendron simsii]
MGKMTSLQTLSNFIVDKDERSMISKLGSLIHLRGAICISGLENVADALDARRANLKDKRGLEKYTVVIWAKEVINLDLVILCGEEEVGFEAFPMVASGDQSTKSIGGRGAEEIGE